MNKQESKCFNIASLMDEALLLLLEEKDYDRITVKEICKKAGVNRTTFERFAQQKGIVKFPRVAIAFRAHL